MGTARRQLFFRARTARSAIHFPRRLASSTAKAFRRRDATRRRSSERKTPERIRQPSRGRHRFQSGNAAIKGTFTTKADKIGTFDAIVVLYREANSGVEIDYWFVSGIGMIRQRVKTKNTEVVLQLEEYTLVK